MKAINLSRLAMRAIAGLRLDTIRHIDATGDESAKAALSSQLSAIDVVGELLASRHGATWPTIVARQRAARLQLGRGKKESILGN